MKVARPVWGWGPGEIPGPTPQLIGDVPSATAILDRFLHHAQVIAITGRSYRLRNQARGEAPAPADQDPAPSKPAIPPTGSPAASKRKKQSAEPDESCPS